MTPTICLTCSATLPLAPDDIQAQILDLDRWPAFQGWGPLPGVRAAEFEARTPEVVGTRIRVTNTDGSRHVEEIVAWDPGRGMTLRMEGFSPPLSRLAAAFEERWELEPAEGGTRVARSFALWPRSALTRPALWVISRLLRRAVERHLEHLLHEHAGAASLQ